MGDRNGHHNDFSGRAGTSVQIGENNGSISITGLPNAGDRHAELLRDLAGAVRTANDRELERWGLRDRDALPVRWHAAEESLFDYWEKIQTDGTPLPLAGQFTGIRQTYEAIESRRLVVLGRAGAGKTVLAHRLILDLLTHSPTGPVPVLFSLGGWNPATDELRRWLAGHLTRDFLFLNAKDSTTKTTLAEVLVERGLILPVLDGFDEIPERHHPAAIRQISALDLPLILTSRPDAYARAAHEIKAVSGAAAIELDDLTLDEAHAYLRHSTGKTRAPTWQSVFDALRTAPDDPASRNLATVLTSPLMVTLVRTVYNDDRSHDPGELLDIERFPTDQALEGHLLDIYLDTVYGEHCPPGGGNTSPFPCTPDQARRWLGFLADHLTQLNTHDLAWWHLPATLPRRTRLLTALSAFTFAAGLGYALAAALTGWLGNTLTLVFAFLAVATATATLVSRLPNGLGKGAEEPKRLRKRGKQARLANTTRTTFQSAVVLVFAHLFRRVNDVVVTPGDNDDSHEPVSPWTLLSTDRTVALVNLIMPPLIFGFMVNSRFLSPVRLAESPAGEIAFGLMFVLPFTLAGLLSSAWGNWLVLARLWFPLTRRLPWRPKRFLEDAHQRGVLRQAGAVYQFRHAELRDHLTSQYRARPCSTRTSGSQGRHAA